MGGLMPLTLWKKNSSYSLAYFLTEVEVFTLNSISCTPLTTPNSLFSLQKPKIKRVNFTISIMALCNFFQILVSFIKKNRCHSNMETNENLELVSRSFYFRNVLGIQIWTLWIHKVPFKLTFNIPYKQGTISNNHTHIYLFNPWFCNVS